ncbi:hypothetical protein ATCC90586_005686 [Pythium insidiosum]|nr:hypothetical protein ATCC90586_005686 [Pythium insidiosum]
MEPRDGDVTRFFQVRGKVQRVMFRQTVIRAMIKRGLQGGATNDKADRTLVHVTLRGGADSIQELIDAIGSGSDLNDWGARATAVKEVDRARGKSLSSHQVTTENVDSKNWNPNCTMYL